MIILVNIVIFFLKIIYFFLKFLPQKNVISLISWQSNEPSIDFELLSKDLKYKYNDYDIKIMCKKLEGNIFKKILYGFNILKQMYYLSVSKVVILDSYCIPVSVLKHKKNLIVIQMWHAIGLMKKAGYASLDKDEGRSIKLAKAAKMHRNYSFAIASSNKCIKSMSEVFDMSENQIKVAKLPRLDYLLKNKKEKKKYIFKKNPILKNKKNILYVPTHRKDEVLFQEKVNELAANIDYEKFNLIIKLHPLSSVKIDNKKILELNEIKTIDCLFVADYVISDYSAICFEAMSIDIPVYFYAFDMLNYQKDRDFFINYKEELNYATFKEANNLINNIHEDEVLLKKQKEFFNKYVDSSSCTIVDLLELET